MIPYKFHPEADAELAEAALFYESRLSGLGKSFAAEVERTIALVREYPEAGSALGPKRRRVLVARFPYSIVYRQDADASSSWQWLTSAGVLVTGDGASSALHAVSALRPHRMPN